jgi:hypothetical protein
MKAQISFVEFLVAIIIFLSSVTYIAFQISSLIPNYINEIKAERMRSEAFQLSELLINDPGNPANWYQDFDHAERLGLSDETRNKTNLLSGDKISKFNETCFSSYLEVKKKLGIDYNFSLVLKDGKTGKIKINCSVPILPRYTRITRIVAYTENNEIKYGEMVLQAWYV